MKIKGKQEFNPVSMELMTPAEVGVIIKALGIAIEDYPTGVDFEIRFLESLKRYLERHEVQGTTEVEIDLV